MERLNGVALQIILNAVPSALVIIERKDGRVIYVNDRAKQLYGVNPLGLEMTDHSTKLMKLLTLNGEPYTPEKLPASQALLSGEQARDDLIIERPDGSRVVVSASAMPIKNQEGSVIAAIGIFEDITEQKKAETALKESEQRYRTLINTSTDAIVVHKQGRFLFANPAALQLFGVQTFDQLKDRNIFDFMVPEEKSRIRERMTQAQAGKQPLPQEEQVVRLNGKHITVEGTGAPIYYNGDWAILAILHDITERKEMQQKLAEYAKNLEKTIDERTKKIKESEQNYRELYDSFGEAFIATNWELNVIHWNKAAERVTTVKAQDALGKKIYEVLPEMAAVDVTPYYEALQQKKPARFMMNTKSRQTGQEATFEVSTYPSTQGIIIIVEDKTEEETTKRLSAIGQTASMVGHDIRNPLQAITGDLYLLKEELKGVSSSDCRQAMEDSINAIDENVFYINKIVSDLQDYTRPLKPNITQVNLSDLISTILTGINIPQKIKTHLNIEPELRLNSDPSYLKRALTNLISNAVQAMPNGGTLTIQAQTKNKKTTITIADTGVGIPDEIKDKVFTPLFTTKSKGQGLGLAVVKRFIEGLNGKITFQSQTGKGTEFTIELPSNQS